MNKAGITARPSYIIFPFGSIRSVSLLVLVSLYEGLGLVWHGDMDG